MTNLSNIKKKLGAKFKKKMKDIKEKLVSSFEHKEFSFIENDGIKTLANNLQTDLIKGLNKNQYSDPKRTEMYPSFFPYKIFMIFKKIFSKKKT